MAAQASLLVLNTVSPQVAPEALKILVLPMTITSGLEKEQGTLLDEVFLTSLSGLAPEGTSILGASDIETVLEHEKQRFAMGCTTVSCLVEIGNAMGVSHLVSFSVGKIEQDFIINAKVIEVAEVAVRYRNTYKAGDMAAMMERLKECAADVGVSWGWPKAKAAAEAIATAKSKVSPAAAPAIPPEEAPTATPEGEGGGGGLFWPGVIAAAGGGVLAVGLGVGTVLVNGQLAGASWEEKQQLAPVGLGLLVGTAGAGVVAIAGGVVTGVSLLAGGDDEG